MCMHTCIHAYSSSYYKQYEYVYIHVYVHTVLVYRMTNKVCIHTCIHAYVYIHNLYIHMCVYIYIYSRIHVYSCKYSSGCVIIFMNMYLYMHSSLPMNMHITLTHLHRWMAPESIQTRRYSHKSDVYAFGILMWEMWSSGKYPYMLISDDEKVASRYALQDFHVYSSGMHDFCSLCVTVAAYV